MTKHNMTLWRKGIAYPRYKLLSPEHGLCQGHSIGWSPNGRMVFYDHRREELKDMLAMSELSGCASMGCAGLLAEWRREQSGIATPKQATLTNSFGFVVAAGSFSFLFSYLCRGMRHFRAAYRAVGLGLDVHVRICDFMDNIRYGKQRILVFAATSEDVKWVSNAIASDSLPVQLRWCGFRSMNSSKEWIATRPVKGWLVLIRETSPGVRILTAMGCATFQPGPRAIMREVSKLIRRFESTSQRLLVTSMEEPSPCNEQA